MEFKVIISDGGKTYQKEIKGDEAARIVGLRIGDEFDGGLIGESGKLQITGGTDKDGFPMKKGIPGSRRLKILMKRGPGFIPRVAGERRKKRVRGDTVSEDIVQINTKVIGKKKKKKVKAEVEVEKVEKEEIEVKEEVKPEIEKKPKEVKKEVEKKVKKPKEVKKKVEKKPKEVEKEVEKKVKKPKEVEKEVEKKPKEVRKEVEKKVKKPKEVEKEVEKKPKEVKKEVEKKPKEVKKKVKEERPIALTKVKGIGKVTADLFATAGISSAQEFLKADTQKLAKKTGLTAEKIEQLKAQAGELMG